MANEKRLIDANVLVDTIGNAPANASDGSLDLFEIIDFIENAPTVDAVEVVRCKDCKHWKPGDSFGGDSLDDMQRIGGCPIVRFGRRENDFCCEGERKDNG